MHWRERVVPRRRTAAGCPCRLVVVGPVMRVTTLKASAEKLSGLLDYYAGLAEDQRSAGPGSWSGGLLPRPGRTTRAAGGATADTRSDSTAR